MIDNSIQPVNVGGIFCCFFCWFTSTRMDLHADQWDVQATMTRVNKSLIAQGYATWFDCAPFNV
eukprot:COSAG02_NODE_1624_length_11594_cov_6.314833_7_plen_64_part_00